jgi:hypothetical protein
MIISEKNIFLKEKKWCNSILVSEHGW